MGPYHLRSQGDTHYTTGIHSAVQFFPSFPPSVQGAFSDSRSAQKLLQMGAVEEVPPELKGTEFYSRYFLIMKANGRLRPILDLQNLNKFMKKLKFHRVSLTSIIPSLDPGDWYAALNLKVEYFIFQSSKAIEDCFVSLWVKYTTNSQYFHSACQQPLGFSGSPWQCSWAS